MGEAGYIGSTIGFRSVTSTRFTANHVPSSGQSYDSRPPQAIIVPAGIRSGLRTALKGVYADIYVGLGYNFGSDRPPLNDGRRSNVLKAPWINFGYAMGIGWVRSGSF